MAAALAVAVSCDRNGDDSAGLRINVLTGVASGIDVSSANLSGTYSRGNAPIREAGFEWGESETSLTEVLQAPSTDTPFYAMLDGLGEEKTYWYRAYVILKSSVIFLKGKGK